MSRKYSLLAPAKRDPKEELYMTLSHVPYILAPRPRLSLLAKRDAKEELLAAATLRTGVSTDVKIT